MAVTANFSVSFGSDDADGHLSAEIDSREDGLNDGATSFAPGDDAYFLVFKSDNVAYDPPIISDGSLTAAGVGLDVEKEDDVSFADEDTATLSTPAIEILSVIWFGTTLGSVDLLNPTTVKASAKGVAVARVRYRCLADAYRLTSPTTSGGLTSFPINVHINGHLTGAT